MKVSRMEETGRMSITSPTSFDKRYTQWKNANVLAVALKNMPKQVNPDKVLIDLRKLHSEFIEDLSEET